MRLSFILLGLLVVAMIFMKPGMDYLMGFSANKYEQSTPVQHIVDVPRVEVPPADESTADSDEATDETQKESEAILSGNGITEMEIDNPFAEEDLKNYVPPTE